MCEFLINLGYRKEYIWLLHMGGAETPLCNPCQTRGQLGRSRMKTDDTTLAAGYGAIGGFNLRQLIRHLLAKDIKLLG
jgi:hypothetical protein